jgi:hypothetical protein
LQAIPDDSPSWAYLFTAFYVIIGMPLMAFSCGLFANEIANMGSSGMLEAKINARITTDELEMMKSFGIEDGDGAIDKTEYAILVLVRIGALAPDLIRVINIRFQQLDVSKSGSITYADLQAKSVAGATADVSVLSP